MTRARSVLACLVIPAAVLAAAVLVPRSRLQAWGAGDGADLDTGKGRLRSINCTLKRLPDGPLQRRNLLTAMTRLHGLRIAPGETIALAHVLGPWTDGRYAMAPAAERGTFVAYFGGGAEACAAAVVAAAEAAGLQVPRDEGDGYPEPTPISYGLALHNPTAQAAHFTTDATGDRLSLTVTPTPAGDAGAPVADLWRPGSLAAAGDVLCDPAAAPGSARRPTRAATRAVAQLLSEADVALVNLEAPLSDRAAPTPLKTPADIKAKREFLFRAPPTSARTFLHAMGIDAALMANNHIFDHGRQGIADTREHLRRAGIAPVGPGHSPDKLQTALLAVGDTRCEALAFVTAETLPPGAAAKIGDPWVLDTSPGSLAASRARVSGAVARARQSGRLPIVSFHWGEENAPAPNQVQRALARTAADAGAGLVLGHHPHVLQAVDSLEGCVVAYSLGNFVFAPVKRIHTISAVLTVAIGGGTVVAAGVVPVTIAPDGLPELIPDLESPPAREVLAALGLLI